MMQHNNIYVQKDPLTKGVHAKKKIENTVLRWMACYSIFDRKQAFQKKSNVISGWVKILSEMPRTHRSLNPIFCTQWEVSVNFG